MKSIVSQRYALSCKFKGNWVEVTITNKDTGSIKVELIPIKEDEISVEDEKLVKAPLTEQESEEKVQQEVGDKPEVEQDGN